MMNAQPQAFSAARPPFRADHVGSFLRPKFLLDAREQASRGAITAAALREVEDRAIREIVQYQQDLGLRGITDGEFRRSYFHIDFLTQLDGVVEKGGIPVKFHKASGDIDYAPPVMKVIDQVRRSRAIQRRDFEFLKSVTDRTAKVTIPSPTMLHFRGGRDVISLVAYPDLEPFYADVAKAYAQEIADLAAAISRVPGWRRVATSRWCWGWCQPSSTSSRPSMSSRRASNRPSDTCRSSKCAYRRSAGSRVRCTATTWR